MNIRRALDGKPSSKKLKVGTRDGCAFFYCGTVGDFRQRLTEYSDLCAANAEAVLQDAQRRQEVCFRNPPTIERFIRTEVKSDTPNFSLANYTKFLEAYFRKCERVTGGVENAQRKLDGFVPLGKREVIEVREADHVADPDVTVMIITGYEYGAYWMTSEADEKGYPLLFTNNLSDEED